jgi:parallel beta-helix repeat protein
MRFTLLLLLAILWLPVFSQVCLNQASVSSPININNDTSGLTISDQRITGNGNLIKLTDCKNITITHCILGPSLNYEAIVLERCANITITNCIFKDNGNGVYAYQCSGRIKIINNQFSDVQYFLSRGQFVQFNSCWGPGNEISDNVGENIWGSSSSEDLISMVSSNGTQASPILIQRNKLRGGGPGSDTIEGKGCGGIMTGDVGGSYITVEDNLLVNPGQYGIAIAGGTNISLLRNKVYAQVSPINNIGIYIWNQYPYPCGTHLVQDNSVTYYKKDNTSSPYWPAGNCSPVTEVNNNFCTADSCSLTLNAGILPQRLLCPELSAYYKFNDNWNDETGSGLTIIPDKTFIIDPCDGNGGAANFNGAAQFLNIPHSDWLKPSSQKISVSCWIRPSDLTGLKGIARSQDANGWDNGWRIILIDGNLNARITTTQGATEIWAGGLTAGIWNHVVVTYDGSNLKGYVNGVLKNSSALGGKILYGTQGVDMAIGLSNGDYYFNGLIDEFKIYSGDLTGDEILQDYNSSSPNFNTANTGCGTSANQTVTHIANLNGTNQQPNNTVLYNNSKKTIDIVTNPGPILRGQPNGVTLTALSYELYNNAGQLIQKGKVNSQNFSVDAKNLPFGIYYLGLNSGQSRTVKKVLIY